MPAKKSVSRFLRSCLGGSLHSKDSMPGFIDPGGQDASTPLLCSNEEQFPGAREANKRPRTGESESSITWSDDFNEAKLPDSQRRRDQSVARHYDQIDSDYRAIPSAELRYSGRKGDTKPVDLQALKSKDDERKAKFRRISKEAEENLHRVRLLQDQLEDENTAKLELSSAYDALLEEKKRLDTKTASQETQIFDLGQKLDLERSYFQSAKDRVMVLQGCRRDPLSPTQIVDKYKGLIDSVESWITQWVEPVESSKNLRHAAVMRSLRDRSISWALCDAIQNNSDLLRTCHVPRTDPDIVASLIWQFLVDNVFTQPFCNELDDSKACAATIQGLAKMMRSGIDKTAAAELYTIATWRSSAMETLIKNPQVGHGRQSIIESLTKNLAKEFAIFDNSEDGLYLAIRKGIVIPAIELHELMICERDVYHLDFNHYRPQIDVEASTTASPSFFTSLADLDCQIVYPSKRLTLKLQQLLAGDSAGNVQGRLEKLCAVQPALMRHPISEKYGHYAPEILVKQRMIVLLDSTERFDIPQATFLQELTFPTAAAVFGFVWPGKEVQCSDFGQQTA